MTNSNVLDLDAARLAEQIKDGEKEPITEKLQAYIENSESIELFRSEDGRTYAWISHDEGRREVMALHDPRFEHFLRKVSWEEWHKAPSDNALRAVVAFSQAVATFTGELRTVYVRKARIDDVIYIDRTSDNWDCYAVSADDVSTMPSPVPFIRSETAEPMLEARYDLPIGVMHSLFRLEEDELKKLLVFLFGAFGEPAYPSLGFYGDQRSGKTTMCRVIKALLDPSAPFESAPVMPTEQQLFWLRTEAQHIVFYDNVTMESTVGWAQTALTMLSTGVELPLRNYFKQTLKNPTLARPIILNGINNIIRRKDHADRNIIIRTTPIRAGSQYGARVGGVTERSNFEQWGPYALGAFLDGLSKYLREGDVNSAVDGTFRMAHSTRVAIAATNFPEGKIEEALRDDAKGKAEDLIGNDAFLEEVADWVHSVRSWQGVKNDFFRNMVSAQSRVAGYPSSLRGTTSKLKEYSPLLLETRGVHVDCDVWLSRVGGKAPRRGYAFWLEGNDPPSREQLDTFVIRNGQ